MSRIHFRLVCVLCEALVIVAVVFSGHASAQATKEELFESVLAGADCKQTLNNGLICEYKVGQRLRFSIKDAGGDGVYIAPKNGRVFRTRHECQTANM